MPNIDIEVEVSVSTVLDEIGADDIVAEYGCGTLLDEMATTDIIAYLEEDVLLKCIDNDTIRQYCLDNLDLVEEE